MSDSGVRAQQDVEVSLVGLSPNFWSHVPLLIAQLGSLHLINGLLCLEVAGSHHDTKMVPITKCVLGGVIVTAEIRFDSALYVIDDGTGLIDCLVWTDPFAELFNLVPDIKLDAMQGHSINRPFRVGDFVRVYGRIVHCYTFDNEGDHVTCKPTSSTSIREIHAQLILPTTWDVEMGHWKSCAGCSGNSKLRDANDVLKQLGPRLEAEVRDPSVHLPDDDAGAWKLFGTRCRCQCLYKNILLYCHCHATPEGLDPHFSFRDQVLEKLITMESQLIHEEDLRFQYNTIKNDVALDAALTRQASSQLLAGNKSADKLQNATIATKKSRILRNTFHALREDGIIALVHASSDTYLLISCNRVLERDCWRKPLPVHLSKVPKARLDLVRRLHKQKV